MTSIIMARKVTCAYILLFCINGMIPFNIGSGNRQYSNNNNRHALGDVIFCASNLPINAYGVWISKVYDCKTLACYSFD